MSALTALQQSLTPGAKVALYKLDLNPIGVATTYYFTPEIDFTGLVKFNGQEYTKAAVQIEDLERTATGEQPEPVLSLPNTDKFASSLVLQHKDLVGAEITRTVTFDTFLDGRAGADPTAILSYDIFVIEQKKNLNNVFAQFSLRVLADVANRKLPGRVALRDICSFQYRRWDTTLGAFVYSAVRPCPYAVTGAGAYFKKDGTATALPQEDVCSKTLNNGCIKRPHVGGIIPFGGFPGLSRLRVS